MKYFITLVLVFLSISEKNLEATPDSDFVLVAAYKKNPDALKLRTLVGVSKRVGVRIVLKGFDRSESLSVTNTILDSLRENSYLILNEFSNRKKNQIRSEKKSRNTKRNPSEKLRMTFLVIQSKPKNAETKLLFRMTWLNRKTKDQIEFQTEKSLTKQDPKNIQKIVYDWKSEILPKQDVFFISDLRCVSNKKERTLFLQIGCDSLLQKTADPDSNREYWARAERLSWTGYDLESIQNNLAYYYISSGNFRKAEESFLKADLLDESTNYRSHKYQLEEIRELRNKYNFYEE
ncbi:hypothetical protein JWG45_15430 [Leptospira sp. 201903070]|uniref:Tetratricopeptide repeat protein n=1 Tax=Leptospira ainlahdjerensis TaxID=2810033 RepID=A0ABS2UDW1_9LEPT|nr:hypothetical protein [Leptospira ainlahdjerensis]MBM9578538.1 hypothetical protein [Leptospira ainlahdjerensis]